MPEQAADQVATITIGDQPLRLPFADLLPDLTPDEFAELTEDVKQRGIQVPVMLAVAGDDGAITTYDVIDGQHRIKAAAALGYSFDQVPFSLATGTPAELAALAFDLNVKRRQLTKEQRDAAAVKLRQAGNSYRQIAGKLGVSVETARRAVQASGDQPTAITGADGKTYQAEDESAKIKRACKMALELLENGQPVSVAALQDHAPFKKFGIEARRVISILVGDGEISPAGNGSYMLKVTPKTLDQLRETFRQLAADGRVLDTTYLRLNGLTGGKHVSVVNAAARRLVDAGELRQHDRGWSLVPVDDLPANLDPAVLAEYRASIDTKAISIGTGPKNNGAVSRAIHIARKMAVSGKWDGKQMITFLINVMSVYDGLYNGKNTIASLTRGRDYLISDGDMFGELAGLMDRVVAVLDGTEYTYNELRDQFGIKPTDPEVGLLRRALDTLYGEQRIEKIDGLIRVADQAQQDGEQSDQADGADQSDQDDPAADLALLRSAIRYALFKNSDRDHFTVYDIKPMISYSEDKIRALCAAMVDRGLLIETSDGWIPAPSYDPAPFEHQADQDSTDQADGADQLQDRASKPASRRAVSIDVARERAIEHLNKSREPMTDRNVASWAGIFLKDAREILIDMHDAGQLSTIPTRAGLAYHFPATMAAYLVTKAETITTHLKPEVDQMIEADYTAFNAGQVDDVRRALGVAADQLQSLIKTIESLDHKLAEQIESEATTTEGVTVS